MIILPVHANGAWKWLVSKFGLYFQKNVILCVITSFALFAKLFFIGIVRFYVISLISMNLQVKCLKKNIICAELFLTQENCRHKTCLFTVFGSSLWNSLGSHDFHGFGWKRWKQNTVCAVLFFVPLNMSPQNRFSTLFYGQVFWTFLSSPSFQRYYDSFVLIRLAIRFNGAWESLIFLILDWRKCASVCYWFMRIIGETVFWGPVGVNVIVYRA